jgi:hypothetical protein
MIVVLDTNVVISAVLSPEGNAAKIVRRWEAGQFDIARSPAIIQEIERALTYKRVRKHLKFSEGELDAFVGRFRSATVEIVPQVRLDIIDKDRDDNRILECASEARADYLVTGDSHLLELGEFQGILILPPAGFLAVLDLEG